VTTTRAAVTGRAADLARSCHPAPTVAVTAFAGILAGVAGNSPGRVALVAAAVLAGQLSIGWSNDRLDAHRDRVAGRRDKPIAAGRLGPGTVDRTIAFALAATLVLSLALGWRAGLLHLAAVGCGWAYNIGLKSTWWSWLPYAAAFAALPAIATLALPERALPGWWAVVAAALLGVSANLTNALPDLVGDLRTGIIGLPHRLGATGSLLLAAALLLGASACVAFGPSGPPLPADWIGFAVILALVAVGLPLALRAPLSKGSFYGIVAVVGIDLVLIIIGGDALR
jgi:4-hydroxybenzoate polyprenyltransferase